MLDCSSTFVADCSSDNAIMILLNAIESTDYFYTLSAILDSLCKEFLAVNVSAILYLMNHEQYGRSTASAQYFLQLAGYLGIPVIAFPFSMHIFYFINVM